MAQVARLVRTLAQSPLAALIVGMEDCPMVASVVGKPKA